MWSPNRPLSFFESAHYTVHRGSVSVQRSTVPSARGTGRQPIGWSKGWCPHPVPSKKKKKTQHCHCHLVGQAVHCVGELVFPLFGRDGVFRMLNGFLLLNGFRFRGIPVTSFWGNCFCAGGWSGLQFLMRLSAYVDGCVPRSEYQTVLMLVFIRGQQRRPFSSRTRIGGTPLTHRCGCYLLTPQNKDVTPFSSKKKK